MQKVKIISGGIKRQSDRDKMAVLGKHYIRKRKRIKLNKASLYFKKVGIKWQKENIIRKYMEEGNYNII